MSTNTVTLIGRLGADVSMKYTQSGKAISNFSLAINRRSKEKETDWFDVVCFDKTAELAAQFLSKGSQVAIVGRLQQERWEKDGQKRSKVTVVANEVEFLGKPAGQSQAQGQAQGQAQPESDGLSPDEIPF